MKRVKYFFFNSGINLKEKAFTITGNLGVFVGLIKLNLDRDNAGKWQIGTIDLTEVKTISFDNQNCLAAIATIVSEFQTEFWMQGNVFNFTPKTKNNGLKFEYGQGKGLYSITRSNDNDNIPITRLLVFGGTKNLPAGYRGFSTMLQLDAPIEQPTLLPLNEETVTFPDIFPQYTGVVTSIGDEFTFGATGIPFDVNQYLISGVAAKIKFQTGMIAGYDIEIHSFDNISKDFVIKVVETETALVIPSAQLHAQVGDIFIIVDIDMPDEFVTLSETQLSTFGTDFYNANNFHKRNYAVNADRLYFKNLSIKLEVADTVRLVDAPLGVDRLIPIESFKTFYAVSEWYNELTLSDYPVIDPYTRLVRQQIKQAQNVLPIPPVQNVKVYNYSKEGTFTKNNCSAGLTGSSVIYEKLYISLLSLDDAIAKAEADAVNYNSLGQIEANKGTCDLQSYSISVYKRNGSPCDAGSQNAATLFTKLSRVKVLPDQPLPQRIQYTETGGGWVWVYQDVNDNATTFYKNISCTVLADDGIYFGAWADVTRTITGGMGAAGASCTVAPSIPPRDISRFSAAINSVEGTSSIRTVNGVVSRNLSGGGDGGEVSEKISLSDGIGGAFVFVLMGVGETSVAFTTSFRIKNPDFTGISIEIVELIWYDA